MTSTPYAEVIGDPIEHSLSPIIHLFWLEALGIAADYRRFRVGRGELADYLKRRRGDPDWRGCNVTMPLKLDAIALADRSSDRSVATGAANLILPRDGQLYAGNTDVAGAMTVIQRLAGQAKEPIVTVVGSGGAARAVLMALHLLGIAQVRVQSRDAEAAYKLAVQFNLREEPRPFHQAIGGDGLINATPLGMTGQQEFALDFSALSADGWVFDLVTSPAPSRLVERAAARGLRTADGIEMLIEQAAESFSLFFGQDPPRDRDSDLLARLGQ